MYSRAYVNARHEKHLVLSVSVARCDQLGLKRASWEALGLLLWTDKTVKLSREEWKEFRLELHPRSGLPNFRYFGKGKKKEHGNYCQKIKKKKKKISENEKNVIWEPCEMINMGGRRN